MPLFQTTNCWIRGYVFRDQTARWNYQYLTGRWDKLKTQAEQTRFDATARLLARHVSPGDVLEIGCGEAVLQRRLSSADYRSWLGIDLSTVAIQRAQAFTDARTRYLVADMETFEPDVKFDAIVFTESIYYSPDCAQLLRRYSRFLKPNGRFLVSIFRTKRSAAIWANIHRVAPLLDASSTTNDLGTWDCKVLGPVIDSRAG